MGTSAQAVGGTFAAAFGGDLRILLRLGLLDGVGPRRGRAQRCHFRNASNECERPQPGLPQAFFGTPLLLLATAFVAWTGKERRAALFFGSGGLLYVLGAMIPTMAFNVPLNETLAMVETPLAAARAHGVWRDYSVPWQLWNALRAVAAGIVLLLVGLGFLSLGRHAKSC